MKILFEIKLEKLLWIFISVLSFIGVFYFGGASAGVSVPGQKENTVLTLLSFVLFIITLFHFHEEPWVTFKKRQEEALKKIQEGGDNL